MPVTVDKLFRSLKLKYQGPHKWRDKIDADFNGVYVISMSSDPKNSTPVHPRLSLCKNTFMKWILEAGDLNIEGKAVTKINQVEKYLSQFWHPDENILYVGESSSKTNPLCKRINQFYIHKVGQKGPHTGGYWLKLLRCHTDASIYFAKSDRPRETEFKLLMKFVELKTGASIYRLDDLTKYFPFANLKIDLLKYHKIKSYTNKNSKGADTNT